MKRDRTRLATVLFVLGIFLAGVCNAVSRFLIQRYNEAPETLTDFPFLSTLLFCLNLALYLFLSVFWIRSVQQRLLPSRDRNYLILAAFSAIFMLILRSIKYRLIDVSALTLTRYFWYLYYVPMIIMPTLFLMTCISIKLKNSPKKFDERLLLIPASVLILLFLTNDLHYFAFRPNGDTVMTGANASYFNNFLFYVYYGYYAVTIVTGLVLLVLVNRRVHSFKKIALPFAFLLIMLGLALLDKALNMNRIPSMFAAPEIVSFCMIGLFESCVRNRLIPYNENYAGFFALMSFPAIITKKDFTVAHRSARPVNADIAELKKALADPVYLDEDTKLTGKPITAAYAFYTEDESELHSMNKKLIKANKLIASENELIQAENELKARQAAVDSRNIIYAGIARVMLPYHRKALLMIDEMNPDADDFAAKVARLNLLNAYIKRGSNLLFISEEGDYAAQELRQALEEFAIYLGYCGIQAKAAVYDGQAISPECALGLFSSFYTVAEALLDSVTMLYITVKDSQLRLTADCAQPPELTIPVDIRESDGLYYFILSCTEGGSV